MPSALLKGCSHPGGCPELVESGLCPEHRRQQDQARGTRQSRGMDAGWYAFKDWVGLEMLRVGFLCRACHSAETQREMQAGRA
jgi:hypothetical protein